MSAVATDTKSRLSRMREHAAQSDTVDEATRSYLSSLTAEEMRDELYPGVHSRMRDIMRAITRRVEDRVFGGSDASLLSESVGDIKNGLEGEWFSLCDGTIVLWNEATAAQHRARAEWQRGQAHACTIDAERHEEAARLIEDAGVTCLAEVPS